MDKGGKTNILVTSPECVSLLLKVNGKTSVEVILSSMYLSLIALEAYFTGNLHSILSHNLERSLGHHRQICNNPYPPCPVST